MTKRPKKDKTADGKKRKRPILSDDVVEEAKRTSLYGVGYKRPPQHTRFRKGESGNPNGRPKASKLPADGSSSLNDLVLREAKRLINVREGGETCTMSAIKSVIRMQYVSASKGNAYAQKYILERYDRAEREHRQYVADRIAFWERYVKSARNAIAEAERNGQEPPFQLPHPDDVIIDRESGVRLVGPVDEEELAKLEEVCRMRDVLLMQDALDGRQSSAPDGQDAEVRSGSAFLMAVLINERVPARFRLCDDTVMTRMLRYQAMPKRQLLKDLYRDWRALGMEARRGRVCPSPLTISHWLDQVEEMLEAHGSDEAAELAHTLASAFRETHYLQTASLHP